MTYILIQRDYHVISLVVTLIVLEMRIHIIDVLRMASNMEVLHGLAYRVYIENATRNEPGRVIYFTEMAVSTRLEQAATKVFTQHG